MRTAAQMHALNQAIVLTGVRRPRRDRTGANSRFVNQLIEGPTFTHVFNGGMPKGQKTKAFKLLRVPTYILVRHDKNAWKYDAHGRRRPESLPVHRRRMV